jgi:hypothetical protein
MDCNTLNLDEYKNNWKQFFDDHELDDKTKLLIFNTIDTIQSQDIKIVVTNYNSKDLPKGPRSFSKFKIGSIEASLYCGGVSFSNDDQLYDYDIFQDQFYKNQTYSINCIKELIFISVLDELSQRLDNIQEIFKHYFDVRFVEA